MSKAQCLTGINGVDRMSDENMNSLLQGLGRKNTQKTKEGERTPSKWQKYHLMVSSYASLKRKLVQHRYIQA